MRQTGKRGPVLQPSRKEVANGVVWAFAAISDDAIREACRPAYFSSDLKLSQFQDTEFFHKRNPDSDSYDRSQTDTDESGDCHDKSGVDDTDSDNDDQCEVISAKVACGVWGLCHFF